MVFIMLRQLSNVVQRGERGPWTFPKGLLALEFLTEWRLNNRHAGVYDKTVYIVYYIHIGGLPTSHCISLWVLNAHAHNYIIYQVCVVIIYNALCILS